MSDPAELRYPIARTLANDHSASMSEIAQAAGVGRTTLHRAFGARDALLQDIATFVIDESERILAEVGLDDAAPDAVLEALGGVVLDWATLCALLWSNAKLSEAVDLRAASDEFDERWDRFVRRAQADGYFAADLPPRWLVYSIGSQALAAGFAVTEGYVGEKAAGQLFLRSIAGLSGPDATSG